MCCFEYLNVGEIRMATICSCSVTFHRSWCNFCPVGCNFYDMVWEVSSNLTLFCMGCLFAGSHVTVGVTMHILSISSVSEVMMVQKTNSTSISYLCGDHAMLCRSKTLSTLHYSTGSMFFTILLFFIGCFIFYIFHCLFLTVCKVSRTFLRTNVEE